MSRTCSPPTGRVAAARGRGAARPRRHHRHPGRRAGRRHRRRRPQPRHGPRVGPAARRGGDARGARASRRASSRSRRASTWPRSAEDHCRCKLRALAASGRLQRRREDGQGARGRWSTAPWWARRRGRGSSLAKGDHVVLLRGEGDVGTQPVTAPVKRNQITTLTLAAEPLDAACACTRSPRARASRSTASTSRAGAVGGAFRAGKHKLEVASEGYLPQRRRSCRSPPARSDPHPDPRPRSQLPAVDREPRAVLRRGQRRVRAGPFVRRRPRLQLHGHVREGARARRHGRGPRRLSLPRRLRRWGSTRATCSCAPRRPGGRPTSDRWGCP